MPAIINSAPDCVTHKEGYSADDIADFILQGNYQDCAGFMTFGPGSTYGEDGVGAAGSYMVLTWVGIAFMVFILVAWVAFENRRVLAYAAAHPLGGGAPEDRLPPQDEPPPQPGLTR